jgi:diacylglycerol kinase family enzyme
MDAPTSTESARGAPLAATVLRCVVNVNAFAVRRQPDLVDRVREALEAEDATVHVDLVEGDAVEGRVRAALEAGAHIVAVGGGDGTLRTAASVLRGSETVLAVLPLGRHNHFARDAGLPLAPLDAAALVRAGQVRRVDVAEVDGRVFLNNSGLGLYPHLVRHREHGERMRRRLPSFLLAMGRTLWRFPRLEVEVEGQDGRRTFETPLVFVGNNPYEMGPRLGQRLRLDEGVLFLCTVRPTGRLGFLWLCLRSMLGFPSRRGLVTQTARELSIRVRGSHLPWMSLDGEVERSDGSLRYRSLPRALKVLVPAPRDAAP